MHELEFTDNEIRIVLNALDFYSRIWIGQYDHMLWDLRWYRNCSQLDAWDDTLRRKFWDIRNIILPGLRKYSLNGSYGIFSPDRNAKAAIAYDMQQEFHSLRHTSVTYKLKLNGGDIKAVQGDSGHSQINMVTDVYSHIIDDDRRKNAELFEQAFYEKKNLDPSMHANVAGKTVELPTNVDAELLAKVLSNPEMAALLSTLAKSLESK